MFDIRIEIEETDLKGMITVNTQKWSESDRDLVSIHMMTASKHTYDSRGINDATLNFRLQETKWYEHFLAIHFIYARLLWSSQDSASITFKRF